MFRFSETVHDLEAGAAILRRRRYGVIEIVDGRLRRVRLRPFPKLVSVLGVWLDEWLCHGRRQGDRCWLYYNQPRSCSNFLAVVHIVSTAGTSYRTFRLAATVLDEIARIKRTDAIVCHVTNGRISDRLLRRWGWEQHAPRLRGRNYIKRFYGHYPPPLWPDTARALCATEEEASATCACTSS
jgi:hypothetical protein